MKILAIHSDTHCGSKLGLCSNSVELDGEGTFIPSKAQRWLWQNWLDYWKGVKKLKKKHKAEVWSVSVGDSGDLNRHGSFQYISQNPKIVKSIAVDVYEPAIYDKCFFVRGTAAHGGRSGWLEEWIAEDLDAVQDPETDNWSWWYIRMQVEDLLVEFYHHPQTKGWMPHTERTAATRMANIMFQRCHEAGEPVPDLAFFGHVHFYTTSDRAMKPRVIYCPGWQLPYDFIFKIGKGHHSPLVGGLIILIDGGTYAIIDKYMYRPWRKPIWSP